MVEISVGDAFLDISGESLSLLNEFFPPGLYCFSVDPHGVARVYLFRDQELYLSRESRDIRVSIRIMHEKALIH